MLLSACVANMVRQVHHAFSSSTRMIKVVDVLYVYNMHVKFHINSTLLTIKSKNTSFGYNFKVQLEI